MLSSSSTASASSLTRLSDSLRDYRELVKLRLSTMVVVSGVVGYWLGAGLIEPYSFLAFTLGTFLVVAGANAFNQVIECEPDSRMERTRTRPLPMGRISSFEASAVAAMMSAGGLSMLCLVNGWLPALLGLVALLTYVLLYTPLKPRTPWSTFPGAVAGAMPTLMGFGAASGELSTLAFCLFGLLFLWQFPHTWAIAAAYREDYRRVGYSALPRRRVRLQTLTATLALVGMSLVPAQMGLLGGLYLAGALPLGAMFVAAAVRFGDGTSRARAVALLAASLFYLPMMLALAAFNQTVF